MLNTILNKETKQIANDFVDRYRFSFAQLPETTYEAYEETIERILTATLEHDARALEQQCRELVRLNSAHNIPFIVLINELNGIKNQLTAKLLSHNAKDEVFDLQKIYSDMENIVAFEYLGRYMQGLMHANNIRISSLKDLMKRSLVIYYEGHLEWLNDLTKAIIRGDAELIPELNSTQCVFGQWLKSDGKMVISNNSKYEYLSSIHDTLHGLAKAIKTQMAKTPVDYGALMSYLEKCEFISLSIGTELALIDNRLLIKESSKDKMTGALSRNVLETIFFNQYELALATDSTFVLAMCDLDHFKKINDTHGHLNGDKVLKEFVSICHNTMRESDIVLRYGGEEFIILMSNTHLKAGTEKLEELRMNVYNLCCGDDVDFIDVTVSIGAVEINPKASKIKSNQELRHYLEAVDTLLYRAKAGGRNRVVV